MKVLQVISSFPPAYSYGGPLSVAYHVSKELVRRGHDVTVFTTDVYDAKSRLAFQQNPVFMDGIEVYHFRNLSNRLAHRNITIAPTMGVALRKNITNFDVVHVREYFSFQALQAHRYATKKNIPYVLQAHGSLPRSVQRQNAKAALLSKSQPKKVFDLLFGHSLLKDASKIIASSKIESDQFKTAFADFPLEKVVHFPNYIDWNTYVDLPESGHFRKKYGIDNNAKVVLFLSRIHERKGADLLIEAFSMVKRDVEFPLKLVVAGPDEGYLGTLRALAKKLEVENDVVFPGPLYEHEKLEAYVDADVFVLPSKDHYESFGNVVLEALACSTPVIVTNNCGVSEWIDKHAGYVIEYDKQRLCDALYEVLCDDLLSKELGSYGRELIEREFTWEKGVSRLEEVYEPVVRRELS